MNTHKVHWSARALAIGAALGFVFTVALAPAQAEAPRPDEASVVTPKSGVAGCMLDGIDLSGSVYVTKSPYSADLTVFQARSQYAADLKVFRVRSAYSASDCGLWYFTKSPYSADFSVYFTKSSYSADLSIFFVRSAYSAGPT